jgi:hypothetical protein
MTVTWNSSKDRLTLIDPCSYAHGCLDLLKLVGHLYPAYDDCIQRDASADLINEVGIVHDVAMCCAVV